jgi:hypothetical protein
MSKVYEMGPTTKGHPTNSSDIQEALDKVGKDKEYNAVHFAAGTYLIDDSINRKNRYSVIAINNGSEVYGDMDDDGKITTVFKLMNHAPLIPFDCGVPILGPASSPGTGIKIHNLEFDGNNKIDNGYKTQSPSTDAKCPGSRGGPGKNYGKGFHNFIGTYLSRFQNCSFYNIYVHDSAGDGFRALYVRNRNDIYKNEPNDMNYNIEFYNWTVVNCGHCALMLDYTRDSQIHDCKIKARSNGAVRTQYGCNNIKIDNILVDGTDYNYNPGMQISGDKISVTNCLICNTYGPGIEVRGSGNKEVRIANNKFINCGIFPKQETTDEQKIFYGVGGVIVNGTDVTIEENIFSSCRGYAISATEYVPDGSEYNKSGIFSIIARNNIILQTKEAYNPGDKASGTAIANLLNNAGHKVMAGGNIFYNNLKDLHNVPVTPTVESPGTESPGTESPGTESPCTESHGTESPGTESPGTESPGTESPGTESPGTESSTGESSVHDEDLDFLTCFRETAIVIPLNSEDKRKSVLNSLIDITLEEGKDYLIIHRK